MFTGRHPSQGKRAASVLPLSLFLSYQAIYNHKISATPCLPNKNQVLRQEGQNAENMSSLHIIYFSQHVSSLSGASSIPKTK